MSPLPDFLGPQRRATHRILPPSKLIMQNIHWFTNTGGTLKKLLSVVFNHLGLVSVSIWLKFITKIKNQWTERLYPVGIYLLKANHRNSRTRCEICSKLTRCSIGVVLVSLLLTLNIFHTLLLCFYC